MMKTKIFSIFLSLLSIGTVSFAQTTDDVFFKAMNDEISRSLVDLKLDTYKPPFFLAYMLSDTKTFYASATLGAITSESENPGRSASFRLMEGDYNLNDENFVGTRSASGGVNLPMPLENDYSTIRKALWAMSDRSYKSTVENYEQKLTALKQQNEANTDRLPDFCKIIPITKILPEPEFNYNKTEWENLVKELSKEFGVYPDFSVSNVTLFFTKSNYYYLSNEGTKLKLPNNIAVLSVNAGTQADDGEMLSNQLFYTASSPAGLPSKDKIKQDIRQMADFLVAMRKAPVLKDSYSGPVIFEGEAASSMANQILFSRNGLISTREQVYASDKEGRSGTENNLDNRVGQKVCASDITIKALPKLKIYNSVQLMGSYEVDAEGVVPADELVLIDKGILRTLLNDRVPTVSAKESNGHRRLLIGGASSAKGPGVIQISINNAKPIKTIYKEVLKGASKDNQEYVFVIRKLSFYNLGMNSQLVSSLGKNLPISKPLAIYRVSVKTGKEELVRSAVISEMTLNSMKEISYASKDIQVVNQPSISNGLIVSYILPQVIVFKDLTIVNHKNQMKSKLPVVENPVALKE